METKNDFKPCDINKKNGECYRDRDGQHQHVRGCALHKRFPEDAAAYLRAPEDR